MAHDRVCSCARVGYYVGKGPEYSVFVVREASQTRQESVANVELHEPLDERALARGQVAHDFKALGEVVAGCLLRQAFHCVRDELGYALG